MNEKFSRPAKNSDDAHVHPGKVKLDDILCMEFDRRINEPPRRKRANKFADAKWRGIL